MTALQVGDRGVDYSRARPPITEIRKAGAKFVIRYSAGAASNPAHPSHALNAPKLITPVEFKLTVAGGLDIYANDEWYESRITEGAAAGKADGLAAGALWRSCGLAKGASIYVSWDTDPVVGSWPKVDAYLQAYDLALNNYYEVDVYAGDEYMEHARSLGIIKYGWRPNANAWSNNDGLPYQPSQDWINKNLALIKSKTNAYIWQDGNYWFSKGADENVILRSGGGSHLQMLGVQQPTNPTPKPAPKPVPQLLHQPWPSYMGSADYFGNIKGPVHSHGGYVPRERAAIKAIQQRLQGLGYAPKIAGWADGFYETATENAVAAWQRRTYAARGVSLSSVGVGNIWPRDWKFLFTY